MKLSDIMNRFPQTVTTDDPLIRARDLMVWGGFRHLPVVEVPGRRLVGLVTERDILQHQARTGKTLASRRADRVAIAMTRDVQTAAPEDSVTEAAARMAADRIGCLPITELGSLVGLVTTTDVLAAEVRAHMEPSERTGPSIGDVMTRDPKIVHPDDRLLDAAARMQQNRFRHLPVVDGANRVVGMLSDRDVRVAIGDPTRAFEADASVSVEMLRVNDAMSTPAITMMPDESCIAAARAFADFDVGAVPVVDEGDVLLGIVSYVDVLRALAR